MAKEKKGQAGRLSIWCMYKSVGSHFVHFSINLIQSNVTETRQVEQNSLSPLIGWETVVFTVVRKGNKTQIVVKVI